MGFMDVLRKMFQPQWPSLDNERSRMPLATRRAEVIAPAVQGQVGRDDDEIVALGGYQGRPAELRIGITFGTTEVRLATRRRLGGDSLFLHYDYDADKYQDGPPVLIADPGKDRWEYLAPCIGFEGDAAQVERVRAWIDRLPRGPLGEVIQSIDRDHVLFFQVVSEHVSWKMSASDLLARDAPAIVARRLAVLDELTAAIEGIWP
jgi:hypothetical protein